MARGALRQVKSRPGLDSRSQDADFYRVVLNLQKNQAFCQTQRLGLDLLRDPTTSNGSGFVVPDSFLLQFRVPVEKKG